MDTEGLTPAQVAALDQAQAPLLLARDAATTWIEFAMFADRDGSPAARQVAKEHAMAALLHLDIDSVRLLLCSVIANTLEHRVRADLGGSWEARRFEMGDEFRAVLERFLASDGRDCCNGGPESHDWAIEYVEPQ